MDSPQSVMSPFKGSSVFTDRENQNSELFVTNPDYLSRKMEVQRKEDAVYDQEEVQGVLEVYVHQARDIHNICIYQKQDVYAKLCLTSDPEDTASTQTINGGGKNPVFNENLRLRIRTINSSLKCEIWMLSRVRNYLEDQLLGFALVPLSDVLISNGKLEKEFSLSSTDLFHSPAGFVQMSLAYHGASPDIMTIHAPPTSVATDAPAPDIEVLESLSSEFEKIEFPDPKIVNENHMMVSEYYEITCSDLNSQSSEGLVSSDNKNQLMSENVHVVESFSTDNMNSANYPKRDSPLSSDLTNGSPSASLPVSTESSETPKASKSANEECVSPPTGNLEAKSADVGDAESKGSVPFAKPVVKANIEAEQKVVQQEIVDMYMKSMQQFTESLAKMKLPMDIGSGPTNSGNSTSDQTPKSNGSRVFYGSRAFF